jgi:hypothetical protein
MSGPRLAAPPFDVKGERFEITYAAHTATCTFLLDAEGICRRIVMLPGSKRRDASKNAARCIGAQYVATLDPTVPGCLVEMPKVGTPMLFARVDSRGRVALVRTGAITSFETKRADDPDPFAESIGVMTSAPSAQELQTPRARVHRSEREPVTPKDPYIEAAERTQRIPAVGRDDSAPRPVQTGGSVDVEVEVDPHLATTDEYDSDPSTMKPRNTWPSAQPHARTLHDPHVQLSPVEDPDDPYVENAYARTRAHRSSDLVPKRNTPVPPPAMPVRRRG